MPRSTCCAVRFHSTRVGVPRLRHCYLRPRNVSSDWIRAWRARSVSMQSPPRSSPAVCSTTDGLREIAQAVRAGPSPSRPARGPDLLLDGFTLLVTDGHRAGAPVLKRALSAFRGDQVSAAEGLRWLWVACTAAGLVWDFDALGRALGSPRAARSRCRGAQCAPVRPELARGAAPGGGRTDLGRLAGQGGGGGQRSDRKQHCAVRGGGAGRLPGARSRGLGADRGYES